MYLSIQSIVVSLKLVYLVESLNIDLHSQMRTNVSVCRSQRGIRIGARSNGSECCSAMRSVFTAQDLAVGYGFDVLLVRR
jgi:hypothetical protein